MHWWKWITERTSWTWKTRILTTLATEMLITATNTAIPRDDKENRKKVRKMLFKLHLHRLKLIISWKKRLSFGDRIYSWWSKNESMIFNFIYFFFIQCSFSHFLLLWCHNIWHIFSLYFSSFLCSSPFSISTIDTIYSQKFAFTFAITYFSNLFHFLSFLP